MKMLQRGTAVALLLLAATHTLQATSANADQVIGMVSKVVLDVTHRPAGQDWTAATRGQALSQGHALRTGEKSVAIVKFKDNSLLRLRELSEVTLSGNQNGQSLSKSVNLLNGVIGFSVAKQRAGEEFRFSTPTSVASIRGTGGSLSKGVNDVLVVVDGVVNFLNKVSGKAVDVQAGFTGISRPDGTLEVRISTDDERAAALEATRSGDQPRQLKLEIRNGQGERKDLIIDYKE